MFLAMDARPSWTSTATGTVSLVRPKDAGALVNLDDTEDFEFAVGSDDGVGIDSKIDRGLADSGELIIGAERTVEGDFTN